jgi:hypothetical protein
VGNSLVPATISPKSAAGLAEQGKRRSSIDLTSWRASDEIGYSDWIFEGRRIAAMGRGSPWWVGDWLLYGTERWGERYSEAVKITGYDAKSLRNMRYVASRFDLSLRRDNLSWSHHALLAGLEVDERDHWLRRAVDDKLSVDDLRVELRAACRGGYKSSKNRDEAHEGHGLVVCPECGHSFQAAAPT